MGLLSYIGLGRDQTPWSRPPKPVDGAKFGQPSPEGSGVKEWTSDKELDSVRVYIYPKTIGWGRSFGKNLKLICRKFSFRVEWNEERKCVAVKSGTFDPASIAVLCAVDLERKPTSEYLSPTDMKSVAQKTAGPYFLDAVRFPRIRFDVWEETATTAEGELHMVGRSNMLKCVRSETEDSVRLMCEVRKDLFGIKPYSVFFGGLALDPAVDVEVIAPKWLLTRESWKKDGYTTGHPPVPKDFARSK